MNYSGELDSLIPSDALPHFRRLLSELPALQQMFGKLIQIQLVIDANVAQKELRWRLRSRRDSSARSGLQEAIDSGTIVAFAPVALKGEIAEHIEGIAQDARVSVNRAREEWHEFQRRLHFYEPEASQQLDAECVDPDDLPYKQVCKQLGAQAVYTRDAHFQEMQVPVITINLDLAFRNYARATSIHIGIKLGSGFTVMVSLQVLSAFVTACVRGFRRLPKPVTWAIAVAVFVALVHPKWRQNIAKVFRCTWRQLDDVKFALAVAFADLASQVAAAQETASNAYAEIQSLLPPTRRRSALVHARAVCVINKEPLSLVEIERRIRNEGYISRSRNFTAYLRRVLRADKWFIEISGGLWALQSERLASIA